MGSLNVEPIILFFFFEGYQAVVHSGEQIAAGNREAGVWDAGYPWQGNRRLLAGGKEDGLGEVGNKE